LADRRASRCQLATDASRADIELVTTKTELKAMAAATMIGLSCHPKKG
jgi:hypothetical protein